MISIIFLQNYYCVKPLKINYLTKYWHIFFKVLQPPKPIMHFPPTSDFPLFYSIFQNVSKKYPAFTFSTKISPFFLAKFLMNFFSHQLKIPNFTPISAEFINLPPLFPEKLNFPLCSTCPPCFRKMAVFFD